MKNKDKKIIYLLVGAIFIFIIIVALFSVINNNKGNIYITLYSPIDGYKKVLKTNNSENIYNKLPDHKINGYEFLGWFYDNDLKLKVKEDSNIKNSQVLIAGYSKLIIKDINGFNVDLDQIKEEKFLTIKSVNNKLTENELNEIINNNLCYLDLSESLINNDIIKDNQFINKTNLKEVKIPGNIKSIGSKAFKNCYNLEKISVGNNLKIIKEEAFYNCKSLSEINIETVESIYSNAFNGCENLKALNIGKNLSFLDENAFNETYFKKITVNSLNENFIVNQKILYTIDYKEIILSDKDISGNLIINNNVEKIQSYAFKSRNNLKSITFSDNLKLIKNNAFESCLNLKQVSFKDTSEYVLENNIFLDCKNLNEVRFGLGLKELGKSVFRNCTSLKTVDFNTSTKIGIANIFYIGDRSFENCESLEYFILPDSVEKIGFSVFKDCVNLKNINLSSRLNIIPSKTFFNNQKLTKVVSTSTIRSIESSAFDGCIKLVNINTINDASLIGEKAFKNCESLEVVNFDNVQIIEEETFYNCLNIKNVSLKNVKTLNKNCFNSCVGLESFYIEEKVNFIDKTAFDNCLNLENFVINNSNDYLVNDGVLYNKELTELICYPQGKKDTNFEILKDINNISTNGLYLNKYIENITVEVGNLSFSSENGILYNYDKTILFRYPSAKSESEVTLQNGLLKLKELSFSYNSNVEILTIPKSVTSIEKGSLFGTYNLKTLNIPFIGESRDNNKFIGYIFGAENYYLNDNYVSYNLTDITISDDRIVGEYSFYNLNKIKHITFNEGINVVQEGAFYNNKELEEVTFLGILTNICKKSFYSVNSLRKLAFVFYKDIEIDKECFYGLNYSLEVNISNNNQHVSYVDRSELKNKFIRVYKKAENWRWIF